MQLMMYVNNDHIESVSIDLGQLSRPGYLGQFKRILKQRHAALLKEAGAEPEFLVIDPKPTPASVNTCNTCLQSVVRQS